MDFFKKFKYDTQNKVQLNLCIVCEEDHKETDGIHHHVYLELTQRKHIKLQNYFDIKVKDKDGNIRNYHPNIQKVKSKIASIKYVCGLTKNKINDEHKVIAYGLNISEKLKVSTSKKRYLGRLMVENPDITPLNIVMQHGEFVFGYNNLCKDYNKLRNDIANSVETLKTMLHYSKNQKQRHIWICGPASSGKSYLLSQILEFLEPKERFQIPFNNDFNGYTEQEFFYKDEFNSTILSQQNLNSICDGNSHQNTKGGSVILTKFTFVLICSNYLPHQIYNNKFLIGPTLSRFKVFYKPSMEQIPFELPSLLMINCLNPEKNIRKKCYNYLNKIIVFFSNYPEFRIDIPWFKFIEKGDPFLLFDFDDFEEKFDKVMDEVKHIYLDNDCIVFEEKDQKICEENNIPKWLYYI